MIHTVPIAPYVVLLLTTKTVMLTKEPEHKKRVKNRNYLEIFTLLRT